ncbi:MAG TPA: septal ring lytic transglycosylase RlpA family protein [Candidatus Acidoferrales bacterium]|nr:septal ring lytic transglycosylase RlpA family protein [Candidatus Acidoferrales bacterium]
MATHGISPVGRIILFCAFAAFVLSGCSHHPYSPSAPAQTPIPSAEQPSTSPQPSTPPAASPPSGPPSAAERQPPIPGEYEEQGVASWYGVPFNGHRTSNGEIYDMHQLTAAHRTLPFNSIVRVTNLANGMHVDVRINDRGPFVANRVIDLSLAAAQAIQMVGTGTAPVRLDLISGSNPESGSFGVQVGAFLVEANAEKLKAQLATRYPSISIASYESPNGVFYRVRVGRLPTEAAAQQLADQLHQDELLTTFVVRLDD